jgi:hypothetical protein
VFVGRIPPVPGGKSPRVNLAYELEGICKGWNGAKREQINFYIAAEAIWIEPERANLIVEAASQLLSGGLGPPIGYGCRRVGVHLWNSIPGREAILLIAAEGRNVAREPATSEVIVARRLLREAACALYFVPGRGAVWRSHIAVSASFS